MAINFENIMPTDISPRASVLLGAPTAVAVALLFLATLALVPGPITVDEAGFEAAAAAITPER